MNATRVEPRGAERAAAAAPFENIEALSARLAAFLTARTGGAVAIETLTKFPAGFSWITYGVRVAGSRLAREIILRIGPPYGFVRAL